MRRHAAKGEHRRRRACGEVAERRSPESRFAVMTFRLKRRRKKERAGAQKLRALKLPGVMT